MTILPTQPAELTASACRACGACCSFSPEWPRFSLESDADLDRIPRAYVDREHGRMRCSGNRCAALVGHVGTSTACAIYAVRPDVCRACLPGDDSCKMARRHFNLYGISSPVGEPGHVQLGAPIAATDARGPDASPDGVDYSGFDGDPSSPPKLVTLRWTAQRSGAFVLVAKD